MKQVAPLVALLAPDVAAMGSANRSEDVAAAYVSPLQYQQYSGSQLAAEASRISQRAAVLAGVQDKKRTDDKIATTSAVNRVLACRLLGERSRCPDSETRSSQE